MKLSTLQERFIRGMHRAGLSVQTLSNRLRLPPEQIAQVCGVEWTPPPPAVATERPVTPPKPPEKPPQALPTPDTVSIVLEPGVELLPRKRERPAAAPAPSPTPAARRPTWRPSLQVAPGVHQVDGQRFECDGPTSVLFSTKGRHIVDDIQHIVSGPGPLSISYHMTEDDAL